MSFTGVIASNQLGFVDNAHCRHRRKLAVVIHERQVCGVSKNYSVLCGIAFIRGHFLPLNHGEKQTLTQHDFRAVEVINATAFVGSSKQVTCAQRPHVA